MATITINKENFYHNLNQIALKTGSIDKIAIVLKDNAYGHGLEIMAFLSAEFGIRHAVVRSMEEAKNIKELFRTVLVLGDHAVKDDICSFALNCLNDIENAELGARVELKVDTGMHRNGIAPEELESALQMIQKKDLELVGVMTHFRSADEMGSELFWQQKRFESVKERVKEAGFMNVRFHSHNSAAILRTKTFDEDLVRVGIGAYGYNELPDAFDDIPLKPVLSLSAKKIATRRLKKGERVGYGGDFSAPEEMTVSTYDLGYGDGWCRGDSAHPYITAEGLPILGRVSMDFIILESEKEELVIMNDAQKAARQFGTISYEMTTALSTDIERKIVDR
ncbi:alanine racemase [Sulfurovum lithotrophicum]|uniref:Alanine racemase n=1 Tax=Sulfurovum lithotrophicum TaxID=206403 RepID=A0A7U4LZW1_9BACT|nr:alanine racemase [Sulfurovum lithotrophicum]AKF24237.1 alanine racemase [Sulfurovum lithotrophicum]